MADMTLPAGLKKMLGDLTGIIGVDLNAVLSLADHEIREAATKAARALDKRLPPEHFLRTTSAERMLSYLNSRIETVGDKQTMVISAIVEKITDFIDKFIDAFYGKAAGVTSETRESVGKADPEMEKLFEEAVRGYMKASYIYLRKVQAEHGDIDAALREIEEGLENVRILHGIFTKDKPSAAKDEPATAKTETGTEEKKASVNDILDEFGKDIRRTVRTWKSQLEKHTEEQTQKIAELEANKPRMSFFGWIAMVPWRILKWFLFGKSKPSNPFTGPSH